MRIPGLRLFRFFARPLGARRAAAPASLRAMEEGELGAHCSDPELDLAPRKVSAAYARGDRCIGAFVEGELAGYCWLAFAPLPHLDGVWVEFDPSAAWTYKSFVRPAHRGRGIAPALYRFGDDLCAACGRRRSLICVEARNRPSAAAARRAGYANAGWAAYLKARGTLLEWYSPGVRRAARFFLPARSERKLS